MFDAVSAMIQQSKELAQLAAATQQQPHHQRRLMSVEDSSSSSSSDDRLVEPFSLSSVDSSSSSRHLTQAATDHTAGHTAGTPAAGTPAAGSTGSTAGAGGTVVPNVESDPKHAGLTQEALDSFKVFEDVPATDTATQGTAAGPAPVPAGTGSDGTIDQVGGSGDAAVAGGDGAAAAGGGDAAADGQQGAVSDETLAQEQHHTRDIDYDEFGDSLKADMWKQADGE
jgi:hypothetical protein